MPASKVNYSRLLDPDGTLAEGLSGTAREKRGTTWQKARYFLDCVAIFIHIGFLAGYMTEWSGRRCAGGGMTTRISLLVAMEVFVIIAHTVYTLAYTYKNTDGCIGKLIAPLSRAAKVFVKGIGATENEEKETWNFADEPNYLKWVEYAVSATLGSISLLYADELENPVSRNVVVPLVVLSLAEQTVGYDIDKFFWKSTEGRSSSKRGLKTVLGLPASILIQFFITFAGQGTEFGVVADVGFNYNLGLAYGFYVTGWTLFGAWAAYLLYVTTRLERENDRKDWVTTSETVYSGLSTFAKITVFAFSMEEILSSEACAQEASAALGLLAQESFNLQPIV